MDLSEMQTRVAELEQQISALPAVPSRFMRKIICRLRLNEVSRQ